MSKPEQSRKRRASAPKNETSKSLPFNKTTDEHDKEQQALALINQGKQNEAELIYRELIAAGSESHIVHGNLGALLKMKGDIKNAISSLKTALKLNPNYPEAHNNLGNALKEQGDLDSAIASYNSALQLNPNYPDAHYNIGNALQDKGDLTAAITSYNTTLKLNPNYPEAHNNLGNILKEQGDLTAAIASYNSALQLKSNYPNAHYNLGNALQEQGNLDAAIASYNSALQLKPHYPEAHNNLGVALKELGNLDAAIASYNSALQLKPNYPDAHNNLGVALQEQGNLDAAITSYNSALQLKPNYPDAHNNLGVALQQLGNLDAAIASYNSALQLKPNYPEAHKNLSTAELLAGDYKSGWLRYEYRFQSNKSEGILNTNPSCKRWDGEELPKDEKLLLVSEQGLGDTLQFVRYATVLRDQGLSVSLCAPRNLHTLIQISGIDPSPLTPEQANQVNEGCWIPLLSVPRHLDVSPENTIITEPYLKTTDQLISKWDNILSEEQRPVIGINWQGNPSHEKTNSIGRSLPLETFAPIASNSKASLLSLQKGFGSEQLATCSFKDRFVSCQDQINGTWDFLETAAIVANCDLVITSDTSVAHLAGGMGKTTWLLLKKVPDWRWGLEGDATSWYPSMRLFRQTERDNWDETMERVTKSINVELTKKATKSHETQTIHREAGSEISNRKRDSNAKKIAYFVLGMEGSGTRLLTRLLINSGATGEYTHSQRLDEAIPNAEYARSPIVWRRSYPHGKRDVDLSSMKEIAESHGWQCEALVIIRDTIANTAAQVGLHAKDVQQALRKNQRQFKLLFHDLAKTNMPYIVVTFENIVTRPKAFQDWIGSLHGLHKPNNYIQINDMNEKHWKAWEIEEQKGLEVLHAAVANHSSKEQQAIALMNRGKPQEAEAIYQELIAAGTGNHFVYQNLAALCGMQGRFGERIQLLRKALQLKPNDPNAHYNLGNALQEQGNLDAAIASYNSALQLKPHYPEAHNNLGVALKELGNLDAAIASYNSALQLKPNYPDAHNNLGVALQEQGNLDAAITSYNSALQLKPNYPDAHNNLGVALQQLGNLDAAIASYNSALQLKPNDPEAHKNLSTAELLAGDYKSGWQRYKYRFQCKQSEGILNANPSCRRWDGEDLPKDKKLLLVSEQGLGDTLQFVRYATVLRDQGLSVSLCAPRNLHTLIQISGIDPSPLTPEQANQVNEGCWIPLLSVPRHLDVSPENTIITEPYLKTTDQLISKWDNILSEEQRPVIGINWQGNPSHEKTNSIGRSLPLETFAPIASNSKASLLSLQKGFGSEQLATCSFKDRFVSCQDQINGTWDFLETAAIVANCDLVITSDTSVAHLAGGMGKTTWLLLKKVPDWRWGLKGDDTSWYPSMRLFRQTERSNWDETMERVAKALQEHFRDR